MRFRVVAVPIDCGCDTNSDGGRICMATKLDPKLVKKIVHSKLIACSTEVGVKNADKISKEMLIPAFLDAVEKADTDGSSDKLTPNVVNLYNEVVKTLGLDQPEGGEATPEAPPAEEVEETPPETPAEPEPPPAPEPPPPPLAARRVGRPPATPAQAPATPAPVSPAAPTAPIAAAPTPTPTPAPAKAPAAPKAPKEPKPPKEKVARKVPAPRSFNRWTVAGDAIIQMKDGSVAELITTSNQIYVDSGGKDNVKEAAAVAKCSLSLLEKMGIVTITDGNFSVN